MKNKTLKKRKFTLTEVLIVVAIIGLLAAIDIVEDVVGLGSIEAIVDCFHDRRLACAVHAADQKDAVAIPPHGKGDFARKLE